MGEYLTINDTHARAEAESYDAVNKLSSIAIYWPEATEKNLLRYTTWACNDITASVLFPLFHPPYSIRTGLHDMK